MDLFYSPHIDSAEFKLPEEESKHCLRVLRLRIGDNVFITDGKGNLHEVTLMDENIKGCNVQIINSKTEYQKRNFSLHIAIAPTKNINRFEWFLEKCTEIGINEITPMFCEHSERRNISAERLNKVIIAALKQSCKAYLPKLNPAISFKELMKSNTNSSKYIAICEEDIDKKHLKEVYQKGENAIVLIGPEGDFSKGEIQLAYESGYKPVSLSKSRLRTETAGVVACEIINLIND